MSSLTANSKKSFFGVYIALFFGITTFILLCLLTWISVNIVSSSIKKDHLKLDGEIAKATAQEVSEWLRVFKKEVRVYSSLNEKADDKAVQKFLIDLDSRFDPNFETLFYAGRDGKTFNYLKQSVNITDRVYFQAIMNDGKDSFIGNPIISRTTNNPVINIAAAVKDNNNQNSGFICGNLSITNLSKKIANIKVGKQGYAFLVDGTSLIIAHSNPDFQMKTKISEGDKVGVQGSNLMWQAMSQGKSIAMDISTPAGIQTMVSAPIPDTPNWSIVIAVPLEEIMETSYSLTIALILVSLVIFIIMLIISIGIGRGVVKPIKFAGLAIRHIAEGDADLTVNIETKRTDEIGQLTNDFNRFVAKLREIVISLKDSQTALKDIGGHLSINVQDTASAVQQIIANLDSVGNQVNSQVDSVEETSSAVIEIARNIESLEQLIQTQASAVSQASSSIEEMIGNIGSVNDSTSKMNQEFKGLIEDMHKGLEKQSAVETSVKLIADQSSMLIEANAAIASVAAQTNLLAMNAAIEAAHAGDAGKGFSVVADEIRKLSENTSEQSRTIGAELKKVQNSINSVVVTAKESEETFAQLSERIEKTNTLVQEISLAMSEQHEGSKQVFEALRSMNDVTSQVRTGAKEMMAGNDSILEGVKVLKETSSTIKNSLDEMNHGAVGINKTATELSDMARNTQATIQQVEEAIGKFKV